MSINIPEPEYRYLSDFPEAVRDRISRGAAIWLAECPATVAGDCDGGDDYWTVSVLVDRRDGDI